MTRLSRPRWGQNFLVDPNIARGMVEWANVAGQDVIEIGPGRGALTDGLTARARRLVLIEIDARLAAGLRARYARAQHVTVLTCDVLDVDLRSVASEPVHVVGSLPYESGTAIVRRLVEQPEVVREAVVMLQREVCQRMTAGPGSKSYGVLSVHMTMHADIVAGRIVGPAAFRPRPEVESQLLRIRPLAAPRWECGDLERFRDVVRVAFAERRKMLRNTLGRWLERRIGAGATKLVFEQAGVDPSQRPERIAADGFARVAACSYPVKTGDA